MTVHCVSTEKCFWIQPYQAQLPLPQRKGVADEYESDDDDVHSEGSFDSTHHKLSDLSESGRGFCSRCSSVHSELEMGPGTSGDDSGNAAIVARADAAAATYVSDDSEQSMPQSHRSAHHTHTAWHNAYCVLTDNNNFPDMKIL